MNEPIRTGLIGCGAAGKIHARAMIDSPDSELVAVFDTESRAAESLAEKYELAIHQSIEGMLEDPRIQAVSIATPHHEHFRLATQAADAGKHILLEKPFTLSSQEALQLTDHCKATNVVLMPWLERRFLPYVDQAKQIVRSGDLGKIAYIRISALGYKPRAYWEYGMRMEEYPSSWRKHWASSGGGVLLMNGIHQMDLLSHIVGLSVTEVSGRIATLHHDVEVEDLAIATMVFANGGFGSIEASCCTYGINQFPIERPADTIMGTDGHLQLGNNLACFDRIHHSRVFEFPKLTVKEMKERQLANFAEHLRSGEPLRCSPEDAIRSLRVIEAIYSAAKSNSSQRLDAK